jgi:deoxyxylulose-5-phosphate reductoisomerase-like protein
VRRPQVDGLKLHRALCAQHGRQRTCNGLGIRGGRHLKDLPHGIDLVAIPAFTKSAIEMAAVANMTGLRPDVRGMHFPPAGTDRLPEVLKPREDGGILNHSGVVEVVSSIDRDGRPVSSPLYRLWEAQQRLLDEGGEEMEWPRHEANPRRT